MRALVTTVVELVGMGLAVVGCALLAPGLGVAAFGVCLVIVGRAQA